jgi:hypothetical protein
MATTRTKCLPGFFWRALLESECKRSEHAGFTASNAAWLDVLTPLGDFMERCKNVFEAILKYGHDEDWLPDTKADFDSTDAAAGSQEKIDILRKRLELGLPLWHNDDRYDYNGLTGAIRPRESM